MCRGRRGRETQQKRLTLSYQFLLFAEVIDYCILTNISDFILTF